MSNPQPVPKFDLYRELEVDPRATTETIEAAYRSLMKRNHPDAVGAEVQERAKRLNIARDWLVDPSLRRRYDQTRESTTTSGPKQPPSGRTPSPTSKATQTVVATPTRAPVFVRVLGYLLGCVAAVGVAQVGAWLFGIFATFTELARIVAAVVGVDVAGGIIGFLGNVAFALIFGALVSELVGWLDGRSSAARGRYVAGVTAGVLAFVFPALSVGALVWLADIAPDVVRPLVSDPNLRLVVVFVAYGVVGGLAALGLAKVADLSE